jgi:hypothetical protein
VENPPEGRSEPVPFSPATTPGSVFATRGAKGKKRAKSKDLLDTPKTYEKGFKFDWEEISGPRVLGKLTLGDAEAKERVREVLFENYNAIADIFDFQCALCGPVGCGQLRLNGFTELIDRMEIEDNKTVKQSDVDVTFQVANMENSEAACAKKSRLAPGQANANPDNSLVRHEMLAALVILARKRYPMETEDGAEDVASSVSKLLKVHVLPQIAAMQRKAREFDLPFDRNEFRERELYTSATNFFMRIYTSSLKRVFVFFATAGKSREPKNAVNEKLSLQAWQRLMNHSRMEEAFASVADTKCSDLAYRICFNQATIFVPDPDQLKKRENLTFHDFLEALARVATATAADQDKRPMTLKLHEMWNAFFEPLAEEIRQNNLVY